MRAVLVDVAGEVVHVRAMSRKREGIAGNHWATRRLLDAEAPKLLDADDTTLTARALELQLDPRQLKAWVLDERGRR